MATQAGLVPVTNVATPVYNPTAVGFVVMQAYGTIPVTVGGPGVTSGQGVQLPVGSGPGIPGQPPTSVPVAHYGAQSDQDDRIYAVAASGTVSVGFCAGG